MTLRQLRWIPTAALAVAAICWIVLAGDPRGDLAGRIDSIGTWGWIVGTWGHFIIWRASLRRIRRYRPAPGELERALRHRPDRRPDKVTHDGQPVLLPDGWTYDITPQAITADGKMKRGWAAAIDAHGDPIRPRWSLVPAWAVSDPETDVFPTVEHAEEAALREIALRQPVRVREAT